MARKKGKGRAVKNARRKFGTHYESEEIKLAPHTMVIKRGDVDKDVRDLILDMRQVMEPFTASDLKVSKKNSLKDFIAIAGPLHVTHLMALSQTELGDHMRLMRLPRGPTLHFKVEDYSLVNDVLNVQKKKYNHKKQFLHQPLLILNGFNSKTTDANGVPHMEPHLKLLTTSLQNMFPSINVTNVKLSSIRRCVLFNYNKEDKTIDFRQYNIRLMPVGLSKPVKKLVQEKLPDLSKFQDISEFIEKGGNLSESEAEFDGPENEVNLPQDLKQNGAINAKNTASAIRLSEIGPRLKLKLIKIEEGVCDGEVLYHDYITKTPEEIQQIRESMKKRKKEEKLKEKERIAKEKLRTEKLKGKQDKKKNPKETKGIDYEKDLDYDSNADDNEYDQAEENREYFRQEVGQEPNQDLVSKYNNKRKGKPIRAGRDDYLGKNIDEFGNPKKKRKLDKDGDDEKDDQRVEVKFNKSVQPKPKFLRFSNKKSLNKRTK